MNGTITQRCACKTKKDESGAIVKDSNGKSVKDHRPRCRPKWGYVFDGRPHPDGSRNQVTKSIYTTQKEAQRAMREAMVAEQRGVRVETGRLTVGQYLDEWLEGRLRLRQSTSARTKATSESTCVLP
jgi:hypothetical protein